jgi:SCY1-like protein 2
MLTSSLTAAFSWSTPSPVTPVFPGNAMAAMRPQQGPASRTITPDLSRFDALQPSQTQFSQPLQPQVQYIQPPQQPQSNYSMPTLQSQPSYSTPLQPQTNYNTPALHPQSSYHAPLQTQSSFGAPAMQSQAQPQAFQSFAGSVNWGAAASSNAYNTMQKPSTTSMGNLGSSMSGLSMNQQRPAISNPSSFSLPPPPGALTNTFASPPPSSSFGPAKHAQKSGLDAFESLL